MFGVNETFVEYFFDPITKGYRAVVPEKSRLALKNALSNASSPASFVSSVVQGDLKKSGNILGRFLVNSTLGLGGLFDVAGEQLNWKAINEDFGQALGSRGVPAGPYLVLPFFGPTTTCHAVGRTVDGFLTPTNYFLPFLGASGMTISEQVNSYSFHIGDKEALSRNAIDRYESMKHFYYQNREKKIKD